MVFRIACLLLGAFTSVRAAPVDEAAALIRSRQFAQAEALLVRIVAAEPRNAAACYYLGMARRERGDVASLEDATKWLAKAVTLVPDNADYQADYGGTCLLLAEKNRSFLAATRGRDAMEKALQLDPTDTDTRQALFEFYVQAPWPLGSTTKASAQLAQIRSRDPDRAAVLEVRLKTEARDYDAAFRACDSVLARSPNDYAALYEYGWCASRSGRNLDQAVAHLRHALTLPPPNPASPSLAKVWRLLGDVYGKLGQSAEQRESYQAALKLESVSGGGEGGR